MEYLNTPPLVSVITVCRNAAATLEKALSSVRSQSYPNIQHIIIDGASTDGSQTVAEKGLRSGGLLLSEPDSGIYNAMNKGLARAEGEIIAFLNADDFYATDNAVQAAVTCYENAQVNAVFGDVAFLKPKDVSQTYRRYDSGRFRPSLIRWGWMPAHPGMFVAKSVYERLGGFKENYKIAGDYEMIARSFAGGLIRYRHLPEILVHMMPGGASTANFSARMLINRETVQACRDNGIYSNLLMVMTKYPAKLLEYLR
jgi:glycosyltransferase involved in cell wall biosynthesis